MEFKDLSKLFSKGRKDTIKSMAGNTIGRVVAVNSDSLDIQPVINKKIRGESVKFPVFRSVPYITMQGGIHYERHPIAVGDHCLLITCERCFDAWYSGQDEVVPPDDRVWDYSDCFALVGVNTSANAIPTTDVTERRGDNNIEGDYTHLGDHFETGDRTQTGNKTQTGNYSITGVIAISNAGGPTSTGSGDLTWTGDIILNGVSLKDHVHLENGAGNLTNTMES